MNNRILVPQYLTNFLLENHRLNHAAFRQPFRYNRKKILGAILGYMLITLLLLVL